MSTITPTLTTTTTSGSSSTSSVALPTPAPTPVPGYVLTALRNQRELSSTSIPIDRVPRPALSLSAFFNGAYQSARIRQIRALLDAGYRTLFVDLYWDGVARTLQLCPVAYPLPTVTATASTSDATVAPTTTTSTTSVTTSVTTTSRNVTSTTSGNSTSSSSSASSASGSLASNSTTSSTTSSRSASTSSTVSSGTITSQTLSPTSSPSPTPDTVISNTICPSSPYHLDLFIAALDAYVSDSWAPFYADVITVVVNVHSVSGGRTRNLQNVNVTEVALQMADKGVAGSFGDVMRKYLGASVFTPTDLSAARLSLNTTLGPSPYYSFSVSPSTGLATSTSAWPNLEYLLTNRKRVILAVASVDADASSSDGGSTGGSAYNVSADIGSTFLGTELAATPVWTSSGAANVNCSYPVDGVAMVGTGTESSSPSTVPSGWTATSWSFARVSDPRSSAYPPLALLSASSCGFFPLIQSPLSPLVPSFNSSSVGNATLFPSASALSWDPGLLASAVWSWDWGMPVNQTRSGGAVGDGTVNCAGMQRNGRWTVESCNAVRLVACQGLQKPEDWLIPTTPATYLDASKVCPPTHAFSVPRTPQQNRALLSALLALPSSPTTSLVLLDYNDLASDGCWVAGQNPCPYVDRNAIIREIIQTSFQEGVAVFVLAVLFLWFKLRRQLRLVRLRRRRMDARKKLRGMEFQSVPA
ncbi:hypothetical protein M427DRAFT_72163 [Gonapodya prolifera JEL478]|uniref:Maintenance of telomere capping protein 6 n=1 Tax=Gonapodya prolifera (strain JEL478) TaxID=1344416 RepID=A0A139A5W9_GONPJ|nr:hypothetical protein M427DRAFT_72163 [Gonapodya prolifera JEL478]|eukprot:KXS12176.1 hypothetical protein M427DRAFT_72163 [Gonapodya prolifera JEL478]